MVIGFWQFWIVLGNLEKKNTMLIDERTMLFIANTRIGIWKQLNINAILNENSRFGHEWNKCESTTTTTTTQVQDASIYNSFAIKYIYPNTTFLCMYMYNVTIHVLCKKKSFSALMFFWALCRFSFWCLLRRQMCMC